MNFSSHDLHKQANLRANKYQHIVAGDPYRLHFHLMPPVGLLNDPNGFIFYKGTYHIFYQWNPFETKHGSKLWGHYTSTDLVHWEEAPVALAPDQWYDKNGCYSGSAVVYQDSLYLFYTGNVKNEQGERESYQCVAISNDGIHFEKKGPVIDVPEGYTAHFRDPKVFHKHGQWYMVLGAQTENETGEVVLYQSPDLESWTFLGTLAGSGHQGLGPFGYMWECPDLFELGGQEILLVCPQGIEPKGYEFQNIFQSGYFTGTVDYEKPAFQHGSFVELDRGFDFYAPQTTTDSKGRRLLFGWMGNAEIGEPQPTTKHEWIHALTLTRELEWKNGKLLQHPVEELQQLRMNEDRYDGLTLDEKRPFSMQGQVFEMKLDIKNWNTTKFEIQIGALKLIYDAAIQTLTLERNHFSDPQKVESRHCHLEDLRDIHLFKDTSSIEIFINNGEEVFTSRVFDDLKAENINFRVSGNVTLDLQKWDLKRVTLY